MVMAIRSLSQTDTDYPITPTSPEVFRGTSPRSLPHVDTAARNYKVICFSPGGGWGQRWRPRESDRCDSHCDPNRGCHAPLSFDRPQSDWFALRRRARWLGPEHVLQPRLHEWIMMAERSLWVKERKLSAPAVGVQFSLVPLSFPWGAGLGPSAVLTLEQRVEAEWFDYPKGKTGVSLTERFPLPPFVPSRTFLHNTRYWAQSRSAQPFDGSLGAGRARAAGNML